MTSRLSLLVLLCFPVSAVSRLSGPAVQVVTPDVCIHGLDQSDAARGYSVFVFCDDAVGTTIGVVLVAPGEPRSRSWALANRFWQDEKWARDVTSYAWMPGGNYLVVGVSNVYGSGGAYVLDVDERLVLSLHSSVAGKSVKILGVDVAAGAVILSIQKEDGGWEKVTFKLPGK